MKTLVGKQLKNISKLSEEVDDVCIVLLYSNVKQAYRGDFALFPDTGIPLDHEELFCMYIFCLSPPNPEATFYDHFVRRCTNCVLIHDILAITFQNGALSVK